MSQLAAWKPTKALDSIEHWYSSHVLFPIVALCPNLRSLGGVAGDAVNLVKCIARLPCPLPLIERLENVVVHPLFPRLSVVENIARKSPSFALSNVLTLSRDRLNISQHSRSWMEFSAPYSL